MLVTSGTVTSAAMMGQRLPQGALHQFVPLDTPGAVARFLDHWKPDAGLFVESDLWPNLILGAAARGVKLALVNARISAALGGTLELGAQKRSARCWRPSTWCWRRTKRSRTASASWARAMSRWWGSLKADAPPLAVDEEALAATAPAIGNRPVLLAAQTHPGEDETVLPAHDLLRGAFPDLLTILVPRHTARGADLEMLCGTRASSAAPPAGRSAARPPSISPTRWASWACSIAWRPSAFLGGTLVPLGGHNVLEPAALHCAVLAGPHTASAPRAYEAVLGAQGFGTGGSSSADIAREAARLLANPAAAAAAGDAAARGAATLGRRGGAHGRRLKTMLDARA